MLVLSHSSGDVAPTCLQWKRRSCAIPYLAPFHECHIKFWVISPRRGELLSSLSPCWACTVRGTPFDFAQAGRRCCNWAGFIALFFVCRVMSAFWLAENLPIASKSKWIPLPKFSTQEVDSKSLKFCHERLRSLWLGCIKLTPAALEILFIQLHLSGLLDWRIDAVEIWSSSSQLRPLLPFLWG